VRLVQLGHADAGVGQAGPACSRVYVHTTTDCRRERQVAPAPKISYQAMLTM
jgi:hypothetical protein